MQGKQDLTQQIQNLTIQNSMLMAELYEVKKTIENGKSDKSGQNGNTAGQQGGNNANQQSSQTAQLANDLQLLKDMVQNLETKMSAYVNQQAKGGQLTQEDVVNLLLTMMSGMMDWATDLIVKQGGGNQGGAGQNGQSGLGMSGQGGSAQSGGTGQLQ